jgi:hypothetical protein
MGINTITALLLSMALFVMSFGAYITWKDTTWDHVNVNINMLQ